MIIRRVFVKKTLGTLHEYVSIVMNILIINEYKSS